jgi:hypothetical protein
VTGNHGKRESPDGECADVIKVETLAAAKTARASSEARPLPKKADQAAAVPKAPAAAAPPKRAASKAAAEAPPPPKKADQAAALRKAPAVAAPKKRAAEAAPEASESELRKRLPRKVSAAKKAPAAESQPRRSTRAAVNDGALDSVTVGDLKLEYRRTRSEMSAGPAKADKIKTAKVTKL